MDGGAKVLYSSAAAAIVNALDTCLATFATNKASTQIEDKTSTPEA